MQEEVAACVAPLRALRARQRWPGCTPWVEVDTAGEAQESPASIRGNSLHLSPPPALANCVILCKKNPHPFPSPLWGFQVGRLASLWFPDREEVVSMLKLCGILLRGKVDTDTVRGISPLLHIISEP